MTLNLPPTTADAYSRLRPTSTTQTACPTCRMSCRVHRPLVHTRLATFTWQLPSATGLPLLLLLLAGFYLLLLLMSSTTDYDRCLYRCFGPTTTDDRYQPTMTTDANRLQLPSSMAPDVVSMLLPPASVSVYDQCLRLMVWTDNDQQQLPTTTDCN
jgi:hypothetical protein